jgi:hypothetical protein
MRVLALICLAIAVAASVALLPDLQFVLPIAGLSLLRAAALSAALLFQVANGGLDSWLVSRRAISRVWLALLVTGGALVVLFVCVALQSVHYPLPFPYPILYFVLVRALPVCLMVGAFWPSRRVFILGVAGALITGFYAPATWNTLHARYEAEEETARPGRAREALEARAREIAPVMTALARVPLDAGVEPLLDFALRRQPHEAEEEARRRMQEMPDAFEQFSRLMDGPRALDVLYVMTRTMSEMLRVMPEAVEEHAWATAARLAHGMAERDNVPVDQIEKLCAAVDTLMYYRRQPWTLPERRRTDVMTVRNWVRASIPRAPLCSTSSTYALDQVSTQEESK